MVMKKYNVLDAMLDYDDTSLLFNREVSCFAVPSHGIISTTTNNSASGVEFDWFFIKDKIWELKAKGEAPTEAYMLHTHPMGHNRMSTTDMNMVYGWCIALGIPIWFLVLTEEEVATYICKLDRETKKVERDLVDLSVYENLCPDLELISVIMYGLSKTRNTSQEAFNRVFKSVKESGLGFDYIHEWNATREWNQITYECS